MLENGNYRLINASRSTGIFRVTSVGSGVDACWFDVDQG